MQIKNFEAQDMPEALRLIKKEFGSEAVILSARSLRKDRGIFGTFRKPFVEVTAAKDYIENESDNANIIKRKTMVRMNQPSQTDQGNLNDKKGLMHTIHGGIKTFKIQRNPTVEKQVAPLEMSKKLLSMQQLMLAQGVNRNFAMDLIDEVSKTVIGNNSSEDEDIKAGLTRILDKKGLAAGGITTEQGKQKIVVFIGPTGVGKTTTIAKLAVVEALEKKKKVALISFDNLRIAAVEHLKVYAKIIGVPIEAAFNNDEFKDILKKFRNKDLILVDTAGMSQKNVREIHVLSRLFDKLHSVEIHLLLSATTKENDLLDILERFKIFPIHRLIFTKIDESTSYGNILNQVIRTKIPVSYFTNGQQVPEDIENASIKKMMDLIFRQEKERKNGQESHGKIEDEDEDEDEDKHLKITDPGFREFFIANKNSDIFHYPDCRSVRRIKSENTITFKNMTEAFEKKFKPCRSCMAAMVGNNNVFKEEFKKQMSVGH